MAYSTRTYTPGSSTTTFALTTSGGDPIGYIQESDIKVTVNGTVYTNAASGSNTYQITGTSTVEQPNGGNVVLNAGVTGTVVLERTTAIQSATVTYTAGSTLTASDLNNADNQIRFGLQEFSDDYAALLGTGGNLTNLASFLGGSDTWVSNDAKAATTSAIDGRIDTKATAKVKDDIIATAPVSIADDSPTAGKITISVDAELTELATMPLATAQSLADLSDTEVQILDGATLTTTELNYVDGVTSAVQTQIDGKQPLDGELTELATMASGTAGALADLTQSEVEILDGATVSTAELNVLDGVTATTGELNILDGVTSTTTELNILDGVTATTAEINYVDGVTSNVQTQLDAKQTLDADLTAIAALSSADGNFIVGSAGGWVAESGATARTSMGAQTQDAQLDTLAGMQAGTASVLADSTALGATLAEINSICENRASQTTLTDDDAKIPTSGAVVDYVTGAVTAVGGFVTVATEVTFPNTQPDADVVVSVADAGGLSINNSGVASGATTAGGTAVTITGIPNALHGGVGGNANPNVLVAGVGLQLVSSGSNHSYAYHKLLATEADVAQLSGDINDFNERYRVSNGAPSGTDHAGDLYYDTGSDKMLVRNAANNAWEEVQSIGNFYISTLSPAFNGSLEDFTVTNAPSNAQQLLISINGVIQKPNSGTSRPSEGFALNGSTVLFSDPPATGSDYFVIVIGSAVNIGAPSNNTVDTDQLMSGAVTNAKVDANAAIAQSKLSLSITNSEVNASAAIALSKLAITGTGSSSNYLRGDGSWQAISSVGGATGVDFNDDVKARFGTGNDLEIYHVGSGPYSVIRQNDGPFYIQTDDTTTGISLTTYTDGETMANFIKNGAVELYHNNLKKFETSSYGVWLGDNSRVTLGGSAGTPDCHFYHDTTDTNIQNITGDLVIKSNSGGAKAIVVKNGAATELYHNNIKRLETTGEGIEISGAAPATLKISDTGGTGYEGYIQMRGNDMEIRGSNGQMEFYTGAEDGASSTERLKISNTGVVTVSGNLIPEANNTRDLGSSSNAWANIYTNDLNLSNEGSNNDVDGSWGSFTIQEGEDDLFLINRRNGKKYKFNLTEVS